MKSLLKKRENIVLLLLIAILVILLFALHDFKDRHAHQLTQREYMKECSGSTTKTPKAFEPKTFEFFPSHRLF